MLLQFHKYKRLIACLLLFCILLSPSQTVLASQPSSESEGINTSLYDVSTALTAYANDVVGSNTNDKHDDHTLKEMKNIAPSEGRPGIAGAFIGYGDEDKSFHSYISSNTAKSVTNSSYDAWLRVGDAGNTYAYVRYGHLLTDLGLDDTGNTASSDTMRNVFGLFMQGAHAVAGFIPQVFEFAIKILKMFNPFRFFINDSSVKDAITDGKTSSNVSVSGMGGSGTISGTGGLKAEQDVTTNATMFQKAVDLIGDIYSASRNIGILVVVPLLLILLLWALLMKRDKSGLKPFLFRFAFLVIGIPISGLLYTSVLDNVEDVVTKNPAASKMVVCTFVDFQSWVQSSRLDLPSGVKITSVGKGRDSGDSVTAAGSANSATVKKLRNVTYKINKEIYGFGFSSSLGLGSGSMDAGINPGMWNTNGNLSSDGSNAQIEKKVNAMLSRYRSGSFYQASAWETAVNGAIHKYYKDQLGQTPSTSNANTNDGKVYQMYDETDESADWLNRTVDDNQKILNGTQWSAFNIFSNGVLKSGLTTAPTGNIKYESGGANWTEDMANPNKKGGLSSLSMYNYLSTSFDDSSISVYSAEKSTSEYTKQAHYSVNLIGSGALRFSYALNCVACLFCFALVGVIYGLGLVTGNLKRGVSLIMQVPFAVMGMIRSIFQVAIYVFVMCVELIVSVFLYQFICDVIVLFASLIETPVEQAVQAASALIGGRLAFIGNYVSVETLMKYRGVFAIGIFVLAFVVLVSAVWSVKHRRAWLSCVEYAVCRFYRACTLEEMIPVFDAWMACRKSLYAWDFVSDVHDVFTETVLGASDVSADADVQKGVQVI